MMLILCSSKNILNLKYLEEYIQNKWYDFRFLKNLFTLYTSSYKIMDILNDWGEIQIAEVQGLFQDSKGILGMLLGAHRAAEKPPLDGDLKHMFKSSVLSLSGKYCKILKFIIFFITDISEMFWTHLRYSSLNFKYFLPHFFQSAVIYKWEGHPHQRQPKSIYKYSTLPRVILLIANKIGEHREQCNILCYRFSCAINHFQVVSLQKPWNEVFVYSVEATCYTC